MSGGRLLRYSLAGLCIALAAFFLLPLAIGAHHIGMFFPAAGLSVAGVALLNSGMTGLAALNWKAVLLAAVLLVLTRWVKPTKGLHPILFILTSAVVGVVFSF